MTDIPVSSTYMHTYHKFHEDYICPIPDSFREDQYFEHRELVLRCIGHPGNDSFVGFIDNQRHLFYLRTGVKFEINVCYVIVFCGTFMTSIYNTHVVHEKPFVVLHTLGEKTYAND